MSAARMVAVRFEFLPLPEVETHEAREGLAECLFITKGTQMGR